MPERFGRYEVHEVLGQGGMGIVYRAWRPDLERDFALKTLTAGEDASAELIERFIREARAAASLAGHPNVVAVHDVGREGQRFYIAMDYVEGASLKEVIEEQGLTIRRALSIAEGVARGLEAAHERGIIHRDIKPGNILIDPSGTPKLTDFGLAKNIAEEETEAITQTGTLLGTPAYMSPEQAEGAGAEARLDRRTDIYSLGAVLYEMLTGRPPFEGATMMNVLKSVLIDDPLPPRSHNRGIPGDVENICLMAMERDADRRYATAGEMADDLARAKEGVPVQARSISLPRRAWRIVRRNRLKAGVGAVLLAVLTVLGTLGLVRHLAWEARLAEARTLAREGDPQAALARFEEMVGEAPGDGEVIAGLIDAAEALAAGAAADQDFVEVERIAARVDRVAGEVGDPTASRLAARAVELRALQVGEGWLTVRADPEDPRAGHPFFLLDLRDHDLERLPAFPVERRTYPVGDYLLFSVEMEGDRRVFTEQFLLRIRRKEELALDLRTVHLEPSSDENPAPLTRGLAGSPDGETPPARPGWRIVLHGGEDGEPGHYRENPVVTTSHVRILAAPGETVILDGGGRGAPLVVLGAEDVTVGGMPGGGEGPLGQLHLVGGRTRVVEVQDAERVTLQHLRVAGARNTGFQVLDSRHVRVRHVAFRPVPGFGYETPFVGVRFVDCIGGEVRAVGLSWGGAHWAGIVCWRSSGLVIRDNRLDGETARVGIRLRDVRNALVSGNRCSNKRFDGIEVSGSSGRLVLASNVCRANRRAGVRLETPVGCEVSGNVLQGNGGPGLEIATSERRGPGDPANTERRFVVHENILHRNGTGVRIRRTRQVTLRENRITENRGPGIHVDALDEWRNARPDPTDPSWTREGPLVWADSDQFWENGSVGRWLDRRFADLDAWREATGTEAHGRVEPVDYVEREGGEGEAWLPGLAHAERTGPSIWPVPYEVALQGLPAGDGERLEAVEEIRWVAPPAEGEAERRVEDGTLVTSFVRRPEGSNGQGWHVPLPLHLADAHLDVTIRALLTGVPEEEDPVVLRWRAADLGRHVSTRQGWKGLRASDLADGEATLPVLVPAGRPQQIQLMPAFRGPDSLSVRLRSARARVGFIDMRGTFQDPAYDGAPVDVAVPDRVLAGETFPVRVVMRNVGATPWVIPAFRISMAPFGIPGARTDSWGRPVWGLAATRAGVVLPRQEMTFEGRVTAPLRPGPVRLAWRLRVNEPADGLNRRFGEVVRARVEVRAGPDHEERVREMREELVGRIVLPQGRRGWVLVTEDSTHPIHRRVQRALRREGLREVEQVDPYLLEGFGEGQRIRNADDQRLP